MRNIKLKVLILCTALCSCKKNPDDSEYRGKKFKLMCTINNDPEIPFTFVDCHDDSHEIIIGRERTESECITFLYNDNVIRQLHINNCEQISEYCYGDCSYRYVCSDSRGLGYTKIVRFSNGRPEQWQGNHYFNILDYPFPGSNWYIEQQ
jgi:hypothetical protein